MTFPYPAGRFARACLALAGFVLIASGFQTPRRVEIGWCTSVRNLEQAKAAGFDYVELNTTELNTMSDADFETAVATIKRVGIPTPVTNSFIPATIHLTGAETDRAAQMEYVTRAFTRLERIGVHTVVFGSGGARRVPDGFSKDEAFKQLVEFGKRIAPVARAHGITIAIEPLRRQESNIINSAAEGLALVEAIDDANFQLMIDFYHLSSEQEDPAIVLRGRAHLRHLHMANPQGRVFPLVWTEYAYGPFFANLREINYSLRMSVEATPANFDADAPRAIALLRAAFAGDPGRGAGPGTALAQAATPSPAPAASAPAAPPPAGAGQNPAGSVGPRPNVGPSDRPVVDAAAADRGRRVWANECITCHGASARGSDTAPSLLRSLVVLRDRQGSELGPFLKKGHPTQSGTPSANLASAQIVELTNFLRQRINDTLRGSPVFTVQDIRVGDAKAGEAYFNGDGKCTTCHSATGDLKGIASRITALVDLQQRMLFPPAARLGGAPRGGGPAPPSRTAITVTITPPTGAALSGILVQLDDFFVTYRDAAGAMHVVRRVAGTKVVTVDPLQGHHELLDRISDRNIHDLAAYLETLK